MTSPFIQRRNANRLQENKLSRTEQILREQLFSIAEQPLIQRQAVTPVGSPSPVGVRQIKPLVDEVIPRGSIEDRVRTIRQMGSDETERVISRRRQSPAPIMPTGTGKASAASITQSQGNYSGQEALLADYARKAGFPESQIPMAIAIMKAESGGNPRAFNPNNRNGSTDTGIFQINSIHSGWTKQYDLQDPYQNAKAAFKIWRDAGGNWSPWAAYNNGAYRKYYKEPQYITPARIPPFTSSTKTGGLRQVAVQNAKNVIGLPYVWGGNSLQKGVDCSGLVQQIYGQLGIKMPRTADAQSKQTIGTRTSIQNLKPGDLVAWQGGWRGPNYVGHIAIYAGNGQIIEAPQRGMSVRQRALRPNEKAFGVALNFVGD